VQFFWVNSINNFKFVTLLLARKITNLWELISCCLPVGGQICHKLKGTIKTLKFSGTKNLVPAIEIHLQYSQFSVQNGKIFVFFIKKGKVELCKLFWIDSINNFKIVTLLIGKKTN
jgi:hypothetical protein